MNWTIAQTPSQKGRIAIVTGANIGLGYETTLALAGKDVEVIMACRNMQKAEEAKAAIKKQYPEAQLHCMVLDLSRLQSVRNFAEEFKNKFNRLDLLINNAGVMLAPFSLTEDGFENHLATNYIGHFLLTGLLLPLLTKTSESRVVSLSSLAHDFGTIKFDDLQSQKKYSSIAAYSQSKLACLMFAYELQRRLDNAGYKTISVAAHPGVSNTNLGRYIPRFLQFVMPLFGQNPKVGADPTLYAALGEDIKGDDYCGPKGFREYRGKATKVDSNAKSKDKEVARKLWEVTEKLTGFKYL